VVLGGHYASRHDGSPAKSMLPVKLQAGHAMTCDQTRRRIVANCLIPRSVVFFRTLLDTSAAAGLRIHDVLPLRTTTCNPCFMWPEGCTQSVGSLLSNLNSKCGGF